MKKSYAILVGGLLFSTVSFYCAKTSLPTSEIPSETVSTPDQTSQNGSAVLKNYRSSDISLHATRYSADSQVHIDVICRSSSVDANAAVLLNEKLLPGTFALRCDNTGTQVTTIPVPVPNEGDHLIAITYNGHETPEEGKKVIRSLAIKVTVDSISPALTVNYKTGLTKNTVETLEFTVADGRPQALTTTVELMATANVWQEISRVPGAGKFNVGVIMPQDGLYPVRITSTDGISTPTVYVGQVYRKASAVVCWVSNRPALAYVKAATTDVDIQCSEGAMVSLESENGVIQTTATSAGSAAHFQGVNTQAAGMRKFTLKWSGLMNPAETGLAQFTILSAKQKTFTKTARVESNGWCISLWLFNACFAGPEVKSSLLFSNTSPTEAATVSATGDAYCLVGYAYSRPMGVYTVNAGDQFVQDIGAQTAVSQNNCWASAQQTITAWITAE